MPKANLLVTFDPVHEGSAKTEITTLIKEVGKEAKIIKVEAGLAELSVANARGTVKAVAKLSKDKFNYTFYWWPVDKWCKSEMKDMQKVIKQLEKGIAKEEKWKMDLAKRKTTKEYPKDIIIKLTDIVDKPNVDLKNPEKIIKVEIIENRAAISLLAKDELLSVPKIKA